MFLTRIISRMINNIMENLLRAKCKVDKDGNPYILFNPLIRWMPIVGVIALWVLVILLYKEINQYLNQGSIELINIGIVVLTIWFIFCAVWFLRQKDTITSTSLICRRIFSKREVSFGELKIHSSIKSPKIYPVGFLILSTSGKNLKIKYIGTVGGYDFIRILKDKTEIQIPEFKIHYKEV